MKRRLPDWPLLPSPWELHAGPCSRPSMLQRHLPSRHLPMSHAGGHPVAWAHHCPQGRGKALPCIPPALCCSLVLPLHHVGYCCFPCVPHVPFPCHLCMALNPGPAGVAPCSVASRGHSQGRQGGCRPMPRHGQCHSTCHDTLHTPTCNVLSSQVDGLVECMLNGFPVCPPLCPHGCPLCPHGCPLCPHGWLHKAEAQQSKEAERAKALKQVPWPLHVLPMPPYMQL